MEGRVTCSKGSMRIEAPFVRCAQIRKKDTLQMREMHK